MLLRFIYGFIFGVIGAIVGGLSLLALMTLLGLLLNIFWGRGIWPSWTRWVVGSFFTLGVLGVLIGAVKGIYYGLQFGERIDREARLHLFKKRAWVFLTFTLFAFGFFIYIIVNRVILGPQFNSAQKSSQFISKRDKMMALHTGIEKEGIKIVLNIFKNSMDLHRVTLQIVTSDEAKETIFEISHEAALDFARQKFTLDIIFQDLAKQFYEKMLQGMPSPEEGASMTKNILLQARLERVPGGERESAIKNFVLKSELAIPASLVLECQKGECLISQFQFIPE